MGNKISINLLFFDDDIAQKEIIETRIVEQLSSYHVKYWLIDPNDFYDAEHGSFNRAAFLNHIFNFIKGNTINLIATDWNLVKTENFLLKGLDIVECMLEINLKYSKIPFIIYSANIDEASRYTLDLITQSINKANESGEANINSIELLNNILKTRVEFIRRKDYSSRIIEVVKGELNLKSIIIDSFNKYSLATINSTGNSYFDGKSIIDLIQLVESNDIKGLRFIQEFIELSISHYSKLNA